MKEITFTLNNKKVFSHNRSNETSSRCCQGRFSSDRYKEGCGIGECGACTVIVDKKAVCSCMMLVGQVEGKEVITIEGIEMDGELSALQKNFIKYGAIQCGFCTPGMIMSAIALLMENPKPTEKEIRIAISGNLCRCTGYVQIIEAIQATVEELKAQ